MGTRENLESAKREEERAKQKIEEQERIISKAKEAYDKEVLKRQDLEKDLANATNKRQIFEKDLIREGQ